MSVKEKIEAAEACAKQMMEKLAVSAPWVIETMDAPTRQVFLAGMGMAYVEGTVNGAAEMLNLETQRREDYRNTLRQY
jgi:hypothetical protein